MEAGVSGATGLAAVKDAWPPDPEFVTTLLLFTGGSPVLIMIQVQISEIITTYFNFHCV